MPDDSDPEIAIVDDRYWLRRAQEILSATPGRLDATATQLTTAIGWFWSVYTAAALVGGRISARNLSVTRAIALAIPVILLMAAYCAAMWAGVPTELRMDRTPRTGSKGSRQERGSRQHARAWSGRPLRPGGLLRIAWI